MQVSWIDPEELRNLASQLLDPQPSPSNPKSWEVQTIPDHWNLAHSLMEPVRAPAPAVVEAPQPPSFALPDAPSPELNQIRERLRAIRDRAESAGLLPPKPVAPAAPPAPQPQFEPEPESEPEPPIAELATATEAPAVEPLQEPPPQDASAPAGFQAPEGDISTRLEAFSKWAVSFSNSSELLLLDDHGDSLRAAPPASSQTLSGILSMGAALRSGEGSDGADASYRNLGEGGILSAVLCPTRHGNVTLGSVTPHPLTAEQLETLKFSLQQAVDGADTNLQQEQAA